jgi:hypothetical protein
MNRRSFFSIVAGALGSLVLPWKAKAQVAVSVYEPMDMLVDPRPEHINGTSGTWVQVDEHYGMDGKHLVTLLTLEGEDKPFWAQYQESARRGRRLGEIPCVRSTFERPLSDVLAIYPEAIRGLRYAEFTEEISVEEARRRFPESKSLARMG